MRLLYNRLFVIGEFRSGIVAFLRSLHCGQSSVKKLGSRAPLALAASGTFEKSWFPPFKMNRLAKLLPPENVILGLSVTSKKRVFEQAGLIFENQHGVARSIVTDNLFARERLGSTGLGEGVAIPHGRIKGLKQPLAAFVRLEEPIAFESPDGQPVSLLIFLLVPEQATQQHLEILSEIAQLLSDRDAREALATEVDAQAVHRLLTEWQS